MLIRQVTYKNVGDSNALFQNMFGTLLTAIIMTIFELLFTWINYHFAINNAASRKIQKTAHNIAIQAKKQITKDAEIEIKEKGGDINVITKNKTDFYKDMLTTFSDSIEPVSNIDRKKVNDINNLANYIGLLLVLILILILLIVYQSGKRYGYKVETKTIYISVVTSILLCIFFGFSYFSTSSVYKMIPNEFDMLRSLATQLNNPRVTETEPVFTSFDNVYKLLHGYEGVLLVLLVGVNGLVALHYNKWK
jgi:hypothetical protein